MVATLATLVTTTGPAHAAGDRPFAPRFSVNDTGNLTMAANSLLVCPTSASGCNSARNAASSNTAANTALDNNNYNPMAYVDVDSDSTTFDSSSANLSLPAGASVLFAGLYWGGDWSGSGNVAPKDANARDTMKLKLPGSSAYSTITSSVLDDSALNVGRYQAFADVTGLVAAAGAGTYVGANVQAGLGDDHYAGWSLIVAYHNAGDPLRNLTVFDGLKTVRSNDPPTTITVSGFTTPPTGAVKSTVGVVAYEGDLGLVGDTAALNGSTLSNATNPATNFFNSSVTGTRDPSPSNNFGYDADIFSTSGVLPNSSTSATLQLTTSGDQYLPGAIWFATELYSPKVTQTKSVTDLNGGDAIPGDTLEYAITTTNASGSDVDAADGVVVRDQIPNGTTYVPGSIKVDTAGKTDASDTDSAEYAGGAITARIGTGANGTAGGKLAPGASSTVKFRVTVDDPLPDDRVIPNTATATFFGDTVNTPMNASSKVDITVGAPDLTIVKHRVTDPVVAGDPVDYTLTVSNVGDADTAGTVTVTDDLPAGLSMGTASGTGWTCTTAATSFTCTRSDAVAPGAAYPAIALHAQTDADLTGKVVNTAVVSGGSDINFGNNSDTNSTDSSHVADLSVTKSASPTTIDVGGTTTYTITVSNAGPSAAPAVGLDDPIPAGMVQVGDATPSQGTCVSGLVDCDLGTIEPGHSVTVTVTARATPDAAGTTVSNVATATSTGSSDPDPANNDGKADVKVTSADLSVVKTVDPAAPVPGGPVTYTIVAHNDGPSPASGVVVHDALPSELTSVAATGADCTVAAGEVTCAVGDLADGATATITVTATLADGATTVTNTAAIHGNEPDGDPTNDISTIVTDVSPVADLALTKAAVQTTAGAGDTVDWTLTATNNGPSTAVGATVTDTLPAGLTFAPSTGCTAAGQTVTCDLGDIPNGGQAVALVHTTVDAGTTGTLTNDSTVGSSTPDNKPGNDESTSSIALTDTANLSITKAADVTSASPGDTITYTLVAHNAGPATAHDVVVSDAVPAGLSIVSAPGCTINGEVVTCDAGDLADGDSATYTITTTMDPVVATDPHQHDLIVEREQSDLTLDAVQTKTADVDCPTGYFATDASVLILDNAGDIDDSIVPDAVEQHGDGYRVIVTNPSSQDNMQTRISVVCLAGQTGPAGDPVHQHDLIVSAPVTATQPLALGTSTVDLSCGPGQVPVAPSYAFDGDPVRVRGSYAVGENTWRFVMDSSGGATADLAVRCLSTTTGETDGHTHQLTLTDHTNDVSVDPGQTVTARVSCDQDGKGIVASWNLDPGLVSLGNEPQPVNRDFRIKNTGDTTADAHLGLLCLGIRTTDPVGLADFVNTATATSSTPDSHLGNNADSVTVASAVAAGGTGGTGGTGAGGSGAVGPAPVAPVAPFVRVRNATLVVPISCSATCSGTVSVQLAKRVAVGGRALPRGKVLATGTYTGSGRVKLHLAKRLRHALRKAHVHKVVVRFIGADGGQHTLRVKLRR